MKLHNCHPGWVATPTQDTSKLALILPTSEGRHAESTPPGINSTAEWDFNSVSLDPKPTSLGFFGGVGNHLKHVEMQKKKNFFLFVCLFVCLQFSCG